MYDVFELRDLVPAEAEQLMHSGFGVGSLLGEAQIAAAANDIDRLTRISAALKKTARLPDWPHHEPADEAAVLAPLADVTALPVDADELPARMVGAWLGRCVGNTMGKPVEGMPPRDVELYLRAAGQWPQTGYIPFVDKLPEGVRLLHESVLLASAGLFEDVPRDDDIDWTILGLHMLETYGERLTTEDIALEWLDRLPFTQTYTAERAVYRNLLRGIAPSDAATVDNPYREWIGALIRGDIFGYTNPGNPAAAAAMAFRDARLTHVANGLYGEIWAAALVAAAFGTTEPATALQAALACIPADSRLAASQRAILDLCVAGGSASEALAWVDRNLGHYAWVHTVNNAALIAIGLLWGTDFVSAVTLTISGGRDTDSNAATIGSVYGALHGRESIPERLVGTTHVRIGSAVRGFDRIPIAELAERTLRLVKLPPGQTTSRRRARIPVILDTDPGLGEPGSDIDDGFAIALALRSPEIELIGLSIVNGNVGVETGTDVARRLCDRLGRPDLPVVTGSPRPLERSMEPVHRMFEAVFEDHPDIQKRAAARPDEGMLTANREMSAAEFLISETARRPGEITVIAIGPMTNLAEALALDPKFATNTREFVVMAGSATTYAQNITVVGDFNVYVDPEAMDLLLKSGAKIRMVGIDQTSQCILTRDDADALASADDPFSRFAAECTHAWIDFLHKAFPKRPEHRTGCFLHDPLVVAAVIDPAICRWEEARVDVELDSELARGLVIADRNLALQPAMAANATVATATDVARFRRLFLGRIGMTADKNAATQS